MTCMVSRLKITTHSTQAQLKLMLTVLVACTTLGHSMRCCRMHKALVEQLVPTLQMTLRRALIPMLPNLDTQLVPYSRSRQGQSAHRPHTALSASHAPLSSSSPSAQEGPLGTAPIIAHTRDGADKQSVLSSEPLLSEFSLGSVGHSQELHTPAGQTSQTGMVSEHSWAGSADRHQQPRAQQADANHVKAGHRRVSVSTAGTVRKSVFTIAEQQPVVQYEMMPPPSVPQRGGVPGTFSPAAATGCALEEEEHLGPSHTTQQPPHFQSSHSVPGSSRHAPAHQGNVLQDITSTGLYQTSANADSFQHKGLQHRSSAPSIAHDRALQNSPRINASYQVAASNSRDPQSKAPSNRTTAHPMIVRTSGDADLDAQSREKHQEQALLEAVQEAHRAQGDACVPALQALQLQISGAEAAVMQACLPQVGGGVCLSVCTHVGAW